MVPFPILGREMVTREGELKGCTALTKCYVIGPIVRCQANLSGNPVISMYHKSPSGKRPTLLQPPPSPFLKGQKRHVIMSGYSYERVVFYIAIQFDHAHRMSTSAPSTFRPSPVSTTIRFEKCSKALLAKRSVHSPYFGLSFVPDLPLCSPIPPSNSAILHSLWPSLNDFVLDNHLQGRGYLKGLETMQKWTRGGGGGHRIARPANSLSVRTLENKPNRVNIMSTSMLPYVVWHWMSQDDVWSVLIRSSIQCNVNEAKMTLWMQWTSSHPLEMAPL